MCRGPRPPSAILSSVRRISLPVPQLEHLPRCRRPTRTFDALSATLRSRRCSPYRARCCGGHRLFPARRRGRSALPRILSPVRHVSLAIPQLDQPPAPLRSLRYRRRRRPRPRRRLEDLLHPRPHGASLEPPPLHHSRRRPPHCLRLRGHRHRPCPARRRGRRAPPRALVIARRGAPRRSAPLPPVVPLASSARPSRPHRSRRSSCTHIQHPSHSRATVCARRSFCAACEPGIDDALVGGDAWKMCFTRAAASRSSSTALPLFCRALQYHPNHPRRRTSSFFT